MLNSNIFVFSTSISQKIIILYKYRSSIIHVRVLVRTILWTLDSLKIMKFYAKEEDKEN
jgi:hypothetical protein